MEPMDLFIYVIYYIALFITIFYLTTFFQKKKELRSIHTEKHPPISVVIPVYNKENIIQRTIDSIKNQDYPKSKIEIIAINDGSTDNTLEVLKSIQGIRKFTIPNQGKASALNYGIKQASGEIICCLDADTYLSQDIFKKAISYFDDPKTGVVISSLQPYKPKNFLQRIQVVEYALASFFRKMTTFNRGMSAAPACSFFRGDFFKKHGGYDENNLTEDFEMALKAQSHNYRMHHLLDTVAYTEVPDNFKDLSRQRLRWCYGTFQTLKKHHKLFSIKYGDFGVFFLPLIAFSVALSIFAFIIITANLIEKLIRNLHFLSLVNFDITFDLSNVSFLYALSDIRILLAIILISLALFILYLAKKHTITNKISLITYIIYAYLYSLILIVFWIISLVYFVVGKKPKW